ncbi:MAG: TetR/AcrR family transcriptional regulator [Acidobacteria bacterium]|nr:TetR/AcrR family transcriptional regulator [Candidatus Sulfomarinibacter sp. MAG AM1]
MDAELNHRRVPQEAEETRERILSTAQKLFSEKGFEGTSVRDITTEAGCNVASVNYHFGGKENLYLETFRSMLVVLRDQRLAVIGELMARDPAPTLEEFLESFAEGFIDPLVDESRGRMFTILVSREMFNPRLPHNVFVDEFIQPLLERATAALAEVGPPLDPAAARLCIMSMVGQLLHAIKAHHLFSCHDHPEVVPESLADYVSHFVRFSAGGIRACAGKAESQSEDSA